MINLAHQVNNGYILLAAFMGLVVYFFGMCEVLLKRLHHLMDAWDCFCEARRRRKELPQQCEELDKEDEQEDTLV